jgi:hypothetical protein
MVRTVWPARSRVLRVILIGQAGHPRLLASAGTLILTQHPIIIISSALSSILSLSLFHSQQRTVSSDSNHPIRPLPVPGPSSPSWHHQADPAPDPAACKFIEITAGHMGGLFRLVFRSMCTVSASGGGRLPGMQSHTPSTEAPARNVQQAAEE